MHWCILRTYLSSLLQVSDRTFCEGPENRLNNVSSLQKFGRSTVFAVLEPWNVQSGAIPPEYSMYLKSLSYRFYVSY